MLIIYFSQTGTTKKAALALQRQTGAQLAALKLQAPYPADYEGVVARAEADLKQDHHPALIPLEVDLSRQETIFVGFPTWWHQQPMVVNSFFDAYDLKGKTIVPFTTSATSDLAESLPYLQKLATQAQATLAPGLTANSTSAIQQFVKAQGYLKE